jgi:hypothetical protein
VKSSPWFFRPLRTGAVVFAALAAAGWALRPLEQPAWERLTRDAPPPPAGASLAGDLGQAALAGLLGGFRALAADFMFLKANADWSDRDPRATTTSLRLTTAIDPRPVYFWINGAFMMANDMPGWRVEKDGGWQVVPPAAQRAFTREQAAQGIAYLEEGMRYHPNSPGLHEAVGFIHMVRLHRAAKDAGDATAAREELLLAADAYGRAAVLPGASPLAARMRARKLAEAGRPREALDWLTQHYAKLPKPAVSRELLEAVSAGEAAPTADTRAVAKAADTLALIRELEQQLGVPREQAVRQ